MAAPHRLCSNGFAEERGCGEIAASLDTLRMSGGFTLTLPSPIQRQAQNKGSGQG